MRDIWTRWTESVPSGGGCNESTLCLPISLYLLTSICPSFFPFAFGPLSFVLFVSCHVCVSVMCSDVWMGRVAGGVSVWVRMFYADWDRSIDWETRLDLARFRYACDLSLVSLSTYLLSNLSYRLIVSCYRSSIHYRVNSLSRLASQIDCESSDLLDSSFVDRFTSLA